MTSGIQENNERDDLLGQYLNFRNGKKSPVRSETGEYAVYGSNGQIGQCDETNTDGPSIVIGRVGSYCGSVYYSSDPIWVTDNAIVCEAKVADETQYWYYALQTLKLNGRSSGSGQPLLNQSILRSIKCESPSRSRRLAIAEVLGALDDKIASNNKLAEIAIELAEAEFRRLSRTPSKSATLRDVLRLEYGKSLPAKKRVEGDVDVFGSGGIVGTHNESLLPGPGVIVGRKGTAGSVHWTSRAFFPIDTTFYVVPTDPDFSLIFCFHLLESLPLSEMNSDSAVPGLNREEALSAPIRVPVRAELRRFSTVADHLFSVVQRSQQESRALMTIRDALLPQLLSGKLKVREAEKVIEQAL